MTSIASKTVFGTYVSSDGVTPVEGTIRFIPSATVYDVTGNVVVAPLPLFAELDPADGSFAISLLTTDDPDANPQDWVWLVTEQIPNGREFAIQVPSALPGSTPLSNLTPVVDVDLRYAYATLAQVADLQTRVMSAEAVMLGLSGSVGLHAYLLMGA